MLKITGKWSNESQLELQQFVDLLWGLAEDTGLAAVTWNQENCEERGLRLEEGGGLPGLMTAV